MWGDELFVRHTTELEGEEIQRELKAVFDAVGASNGRVPVSVVVSSPVFDEFFPEYSGVWGRRTWRAGAGYTHAAL